MRHRLTTWALALGCAASGAFPPVLSAQADSDPKPLTAAAYGENIAQMQSLVEACKARAAACDAAKAEEDFTVAGADGKRFTIRRDWLRDALAEAKTGNDSVRAFRMARCAERLSADAIDAGTPAAATASLAAARAKTDAILAASEFRHVQQRSWLDERLALLAMWLGMALNRAFSHLPRSPWVVPLVEWGALAAAVAALLVWGWRTTNRQRLAVTAPAADRQLQWQREADDWARRADEQAAAGDWREAVHCLYWAAIVLLEGRRLWRANRARTPREYLPLLEAGSPRQAALGALTRIFERIWYGLRPATQSDFERAHALLEALKAA